MGGAISTRGMPYLLIHEHRLCLLESIERIGSLRVARLVRVNEERFHAVAFLDVGFGHAWFEVEHGIRIEFEGFEDAVYFGILNGISELSGRSKWVKDTLSNSLASASRASSAASSSSPPPSSLMSEASSSLMTMILI